MMSSSDSDKQEEVVRFDGFIEVYLHELEYSDEKMQQMCWERMAQQTPKLPSTNLRHWATQTEQQMASGAAVVSNAEEDM